MSRFSIGPATLLVPDHGGRELQVTDFCEEVHDAREMPAVVTAPHGLLTEIACERWGGAGAFVAVTRGESAPAYDRLLDGGRRSVKACEDGADRLGSAEKASPVELSGVLEGPVA